MTALIPGAGLSFQAHDLVTLFGGVHRGYAPPLVKNAITSAGETYELDAELSWNWEAGFRLAPKRAVQAELTYFRIDFCHQIIASSPSGGATTALVNAGETLNEGIESSVRVDWERLSTALPVYTEVRYMRLSKAEFTRNPLYQGNRLPYAPKNTFTVLLGMRRREGFGAQMDGSYVGAQFADNKGTLQPSNDGTVGLIPGRWVWNTMADYTVRRERYEIRPYVTVKNLANALYIASRAPAGIQPGLFRQVNAGLRFVF